MSEKTGTEVIGARYFCSLGAAVVPGEDISLVMMNDTGNLGPEYSFDWQLRPGNQAYMLYKSRTLKCLGVEEREITVNGITCVTPVLIDVPIGGLSNVTLEFPLIGGDAAIIRVNGHILIYKTVIAAPGKFLYTPYLLADDKLASITDAQQREDTLVKNNFSSYFMAKYLLG